MSGVPVADCLVAFSSFDENDPRTGTQARSDANGQFAMEVGDRGGYLSSRDPRFATVFLGDTRAPDLRIPPVVVVAPSRPIEGEVVGEDGLPLEGAEVSIGNDFDLRVPRSRLQRSSRRSWTIWTPKDGRFSILDAPAIEDASLRVSRERYGSVELSLASQPGVIRVELRRLPRGRAHIEGVVLDASGTPVRRARVAVGSWSRASKDDGTFELDPPHPELAGDAPEVLAFAAGWLPARATAREGEVVIILRERIPSIRCLVMDASGNPVPGAVVELLDPPTAAEISRAAGLEPRPDEAEGQATMGRDPTEADDRGRFEIGVVLPRGFTLRAYDPGTLASAEAVGVVPGTEVELRFAARPLVAAKGRVVDPRGRPIEGASVRLFRGTGGSGEIESAEQWTDKDGRFAWSVVEGEALSIGVRVQSYAIPRRYPVEPQKEGEQTLVAGRAARVRVQVTTPGMAVDALRILDARGEVLWLGEGDGSRESLRNTASDEASDELDLADDGGTEPFWVSEDATTLVLYGEGVEVLRVPIRVVFGETTVIRP